MTCQKVALFGALGLLVFTMLACSSPTTPPFPEKTFTAPWSMEATAIERLRIRVNAVNLGDDMARVVAAVGVPDSDHTVKKNQTNRIFTYYVSRQRANSPVESDKMVKIDFDCQGRVRATYSNVEGITTRNWP